jgi:hypothetical protein
MVLIAGKRYKFYNSINGSTGTPHSKSRLISALFTGEYDKDNGNALFVDNGGNTWSVPKEKPIKQ